eukprot:TRINITY_DN5142_c0_g1_i2.p1 TRINITY_DN5142_c0_g1~~TRINITY_DN5142_c0_g1_i2.p1  ORF type:complete len:403 (-),score=89.70 TRINITY_DN5142_c0_g1_i2:224-1432(-)
MSPSSKKLLWICLITTILFLSSSTLSESSRLKERTVSKRAPLSVHHSFEGPFVVPNWLLQGSAYFRENYVRLTPDRQSRTGALWNAAPVRLQSWEATIGFRIHGQGRTGADGLAFWYIKETNTGSLFGGDASFVGLGVVIDTYDNDRSGVHPRLMVLVSDGSQEYSHNHDHADGAGMERGGCFFPARNTGTKSAMRITYTPERKLVVETDVEEVGQWRLCTTVENLDLPTGYFFGFTAATGELADNHDIHSLIVKNLNTETSEIYSAEQFTLAGLQNRFERKLDDIQKALPALSKAGSATVQGSGGAVLTPQVLGTFDNLKRTLLSLQTEIKNEAVNLHRKLDLISIDRASKNANIETGQPVVVEESSSWLSWIILLLLVLILSVLIHFQYQTRKELNKKLF